MSTEGGKLTSMAVHSIIDDHDTQDFDWIQILLLGIFSIAFFSLKKYFLRPCNGVSRVERGSACPLSSWDFFFNETAACPPTEWRGSDQGSYCAILN